MVTSVTHGFWNCNDFVESELQATVLLKKKV